MKKKGERARGIMISPWSILAYAPTFAGFFILCAVLTERYDPIAVEIYEPVNMIPRRNVETPKATWNHADIIAMERPIPCPFSWGYLLLQASFWDLCTPYDRFTDIPHICL